MCRMQRSGSGGFASADAARVGGGLYSNLLEAACMMATDPSPRVAHAGRGALRTADLELVPVATSAASLNTQTTTLAPAREALRLSGGMSWCQVCAGHGALRTADLELVPVSTPAASLPCRPPRWPLQVRVAAEQASR